MATKTEDSAKQREVMKDLSHPEPTQVRTDLRLAAPPASGVLHGAFTTTGHSYLYLRNIHVYIYIG